MYTTEYMCWIVIFCTNSTACNAQWKIWFQAHIVEQLKSYLMVLESWESDETNLDVPLFARGTFCEHLRRACTKASTAELMSPRYRT